MKLLVYIERDYLHGVAVSLFQVGMFALFTAKSFACDGICLLRNLALLPKLIEQVGTYALYSRGVRLESRPVHWLS
jgi:hypothetical protein